MIKPELWLGALTSPKETFKKARKLAGFEGAIVQIVLAILISSALVMVRELVFQLPEAVVGAEAAGYRIGTTLIISIAAYAIYSALLFGVSKGLGSKGEFKTQLWLTSLYSVPLSILGGLLVFIPLAGIVMAAILGYYALYLLFRALSEAHQYSRARAIGTMLVYFVISGIVMYTLYYILPGGQAVLFKIAVTP